MTALEKDRTCYYVEAAGTKWAVRFDHSDETAQSFDDKARALKAARDAAEARWEVFGLRSCVQVRHGDGTLESDAKFG